MSLHEYRRSLIISVMDEPFYALIMAAMRAADVPTNIGKLQTAFPATYREFIARRKVLLGVLPDKDGHTADEYMLYLTRQRAQEEENDRDS